MIFENQEQLDACLVYWQKVLRLQDWTIRARIKRSYEMTHKDADGYIDHHHCIKSAMITLIDPADYEPACWSDLDHEQVLVHEMLHIYEGAIMEKLDDDAAKTALIEREQLCECLASAFVALNRKQ